MKWFNCTFSVVLVTSVATLSGFALSTQAQENLDGYYSNDLLDAVLEAKQSTHHYDYSSTYRYKRTTAQSIEMDRLDLGEMEDTGLAGALDAPAAGVDTSSEEDSLVSVDDQLLRKEQAEVSQTYTLPTRGIATDSSVSHTQNGIMYSQGVENSSTLVSTPRP